jgi:hypothetical protein
VLVKQFLPKTLLEVGGRMATNSKHVWTDLRGGYWSVACGKVPRKRGRPANAHLFKLVGEKLPFDSLKDVHALSRMELGGYNPYGVYIAHDSILHGGRRE